MTVRFAVWIIDDLYLLVSIQFRTCTCQQEDGEKKKESARNFGLELHSHPF